MAATESRGRELIRPDDSPSPDDGRIALRYARSLLGSLGVRRGPGPAGGVHPAIAWARSGAMAVTGHPDRGAVVCPAPLAAAAEGAAMALSTLAPGTAIDSLDGAMLLGERAALAGHVRRGSASPGGACRLLATATTPVAVNLARPSDWDCVPAWLQDDAWTPSDEASMWRALVQRVSLRESATLVEQARAVGLAVADAAEQTFPGRPWFEVVAGEPYRDAGAAPTTPARRPLVVDLSSLWAGPLCTHILAMLGARVIKVESVTRPDGARLGEPRFFDLMNGGKESVALDFASERGRGRLRELISRADIVVEASRPRALRQLGIMAEDLVAGRMDLTWIALSGYGRAEPEANWIAYGDDAGVAAGLSSLLHEVTGDWLVCGDAIADPLTGLHAALAAWASWSAGGSRLVSLALRDVAAHAAAFELPGDREARCARHRAWSERLASLGIEASAPRARPATCAAPALGEHTDRVLTEFGIG